MKSLMGSSLLAPLVLPSLAACATLPGKVGPGKPGATDITIERVTTPDSPGRYRHPASITELDNGDLYVAYYAGSGEYGDDTAVYATRKVKGSETWTPAQTIADTPWRSEGNPVVWQAPDGLVWLFYVNRYGETWSQSRIKAKVSRDGAKTWSDSFMLTFREGTMVRGKPIVLSDGSYLLGIYHETGGDREHVGADTVSLFLRHDPKHRTWTESDPIRSARGNLQPAAVELEKNHLVAYCRRGGGYGPVTDGYIVRAESHDGGKTWTEGENTELPNPNAAIDFLKLQNGNLLLVYNDSMSRRSPLTAAVSTDGDKTYPHRRNIVEGPGPYAYPYAIQTRDGRIHVIFTSNRRTQIYHAVFEESAILPSSAR